MVTVAPMSVKAGYQAEMQRIDEDIAALGDAEALARRSIRAGDAVRLSSLPEGLDLRRSGSTERSRGRASTRALPLLSNPGDLYLLKANIAFKLHRLADVEAALRAVPAVRDSNEGKLLRADLDFQHGRYREAESGYARRTGNRAVMGRLSPAWRISAAKWAMPPVPTVSTAKPKTS